MHTKVQQVVVCVHLGSGGDATHVQDGLIHVRGDAYLVLSEWLKGLVDYNFQGI